MDFLYKGESCRKQGAVTKAIGTQSKLPLAVYHKEEYEKIVSLINQIEASIQTRFSP